MEIDGKELFSHRIFTKGTYQHNNHGFILLSRNGTTEFDEFTYRIPSNRRVCPSIGNTFQLERIQ